MKVSTKNKNKNITGELRLKERRKGKVKFGTFTMGCHKASQHLSTKFYGWRYKNKAMGLCVFGTMFKNEKVTARCFECENKQY